MKHFVINPPVFFGSALLLTIFLALGIFAPQEADLYFGQLQGVILKNFGWFYLISMAAILISILLIALSRFGNIRLGPDDSTPDFAYHSWVAMLFAAGMGIGLMYYGVSEPMSHFVAPPDADPLTPAAMREAMNVTFFHWGINAWAVFALVGLVLAYFGYRYNLPLTIRSGLYPLLKERINGPIGHAVDIFAIIGTLFGLATSLGLGVSQINAGLNFLFDWPMSSLVQVALIVVITVIATFSVLSGLDKGIRILSEFNLFLAAALMAFVFLFGPSIQLLRDFVQNIGVYLDTIVLRTFNIYAYEPTPWIDKWTLFYWAWWISWSPFVGMFIARISRGRTIREFVLNVLFIPSGFVFLWMTIFGNTAMILDQTVAQGAISSVVNSNISLGLFEFLSHLPFSGLTSIVAVFLIIIFFVTSYDSGALVVDTIAAGGKSETTHLQRIFWCFIAGAVASTLLLAGGLSALQAATIVSALPFTFVLLALIWSLVKGLRADAMHMTWTPSTGSSSPAISGASWQRRLGHLLRTPTAPQIERFIDREVQEALQSVKAELERRGTATTFTHDKENHIVQLTVPAEGTRDFVYGVHRTEHRLPVFSASQANRQELRHEARTFFADGSAGYDIMDCDKEQIIGDVISQLERYIAIKAIPAAQILAVAPEHERESMGE